MITMKEMGKIRRWYYRDGMSYSEISRITGHSRNSVKEWLKKPEGSEPKYRRQVQCTKITAYADVLNKALETDAHRLKRERRSVAEIVRGNPIDGLYRGLQPGYRIHPEVA